MISRFIVVVLLCFFSSFLAGQTRPAKKQISLEEQYQKRIRQQYLSGVYIPIDLADAFAQFNQLIEKPTQDKFKSVPEGIAVKKLYFSFGRWISYNYGFREGSRFSVYLNQLGIYHPEDMVNFVITTYHRNLNKSKLDVKPLLESLIENREKIKLENKLKGDVISSEKRKVEVHPDSLKQN